MKYLLLAFVFASSVFAQVYSVNITTPGNYGSVPAVTASGGSCSAQPTFAVTLTVGGALQTITATFAGTGCQTPPTLAIAGSGGGAATAVLLPASIVLLSTVPSLSGQVLQPSSAGTYLAWVFECLLTVPAARVGFYQARLFPLPGTNNATQFLTPPAGLSGALTSGVLAAYDDQVILYSAASTAMIESAVQASCANQQTAMNAWNPWAHYGSTYLNGVWTITTIP